MKIPKNLASEIISRYKQADLPCLSDTLVRLSRLNPDSESAFEELSGIILEDMGLTGKVIRTVNSVYYRRCGQEITTVTQALVLLGFDTVRKIALNMAVLDLAEKNNDNPLLSLIFSSFTAAFLAQDLLDSRHEALGESIFVMGLFHCLGRIILCLHDSRLYEALAEMEFEAEEKREAVESLFSDLGRGLGKLWGLPRSMIQSMEGGEVNRDSNSQMIGMFHLAVRASLSEGGSKVLAKVLEKIAAETTFPMEAIAKRMSKAFDKSLSLSPLFKKRTTLKRVKTVLKKFDGLHEGEDLNAPVASDLDQIKGISRFLRLLTHLTSTMIQNSFRLEEVYLFAAEALLRGVEMERVTLALLTADKRWLRPRYVIGKNTEGVKARLNMPFPPRNHDVVRCFEQNRISTLNWHLVTGKNELTSQILPQGFVCLAPIVVNNKPIGCFLLDRPKSKREILPEDVLMVTAVRDMVVLATKNR